MINRYAGIYMHAEGGAWGIPGDKTKKIPLMKKYEVAEVSEC